MRYFHIKYGFSANEIKPIDHTEVEKAIYCHLTGKVGVFKNGSVSGVNIIEVGPDYNAELGWAPDHKLDGHDFNDLDREGLRDKYTQYIASQKERVQYLMHTKQEHLIGKGAKIPELERPTMELREGDTKSMKQLLKGKKRI